MRATTYGVFTRDARTASKFLAETAALIAQESAARGDGAASTAEQQRSASASTSSGPSPFLTATITSPPYGRLVDYGSDRQIGFGQTDDEYLRDCRQLFADLYRWTKQDGSLWVIADSFTDDKRAAGSPSRLRMLPFELAELAEDEGWTLKDVVIWHKDRTLPWSHHGRFRNAFESVLLLVKTPRFKFHIDRLREAGDLARWWVRYPERYHGAGKAPDNVWHIPIPVQGSWGRKSYQHACPLPPELVRRLVLLSTDPGDAVYDPFAGIGTVPAVAAALGRRGLGTELNSSFVRYYNRHVKSEIAALIDGASHHTDGGPTPTTLATMRALKFPKTLMSRLRSEKPELPAPTLAIGCIADPASQGADEGTSRSVVTASWTFLLPEVAPDERESVQSALKELAGRPPLSKFGVACDLRVVDSEEAKRILGASEWHLYEHGRTWSSGRAVVGPEALELQTSPLRGAFAPIVADRRVHVDPNLVADPAADPY